MNKEPDSSQRKALGKGLSALLPSRSNRLEGTAPERAGWQQAQSSVDSAGSLMMLPLDAVQVGGDQPREAFDAVKLEELARSIEANGLIQPITVFAAETGRYVIVAGERRWRAAKLAGLKDIPAFVRNVNGHRVLELALIENLQREDLNAMEIAQGFHRLLTEYGLSHEQIAERTGKDRSTVTNFLRLLRLSPAVTQEVIKGSITVGHARALLNIDDPDEQLHACQEIIAKKLSVRDTEALVKRLADHPGTTKRSRAKQGEDLDPNVRVAVEEMSAALGTRVRLIPRPGDKGRLEIEYYSADDLERIYSIIVRPA